jgi:lysophospholipase L1-like esterase
VDTLLAKVPIVVLVTSPYIQTGWGVTEAVANDPINDHARMDRLNGLLREIAGEQPRVVVVDLAGHLLADPSKPLTNPDLRPDGVHFTPAAARAVANWLGPAIVSAVRGA